MGKTVVEGHIIREITPLSGKDCFYIADRNKTEFTYPMHCHKEFELNFVENAAGVQRIRIWNMSGNREVASLITSEKLPFSFLPIS